MKIEEESNNNCRKIMNKKPIDKVKLENDE